jgi:hypothetical protein
MSTIKYINKDACLEEYLNGKTVEELENEYYVPKFTIVYLLAGFVYHYLNEKFNKPANHKKSWSSDNLKYLSDNSHLDLEVLSASLERTQFSIICQQILLHNCPRLNNIHE